MEVTYKYYSSVFKGKLCQVEFEELVSVALDMAKQYAEQFIAPWALKPDIEYYCIKDIKKAVCYQIDYLAFNGGIKVLSGSSELDLTSVSKDGFTYNYNADRGIKFNGIPFSPLAINIIRCGLHSNGLMCRRAKRYD